MSAAYIELHSGTPRAYVIRTENPEHWSEGKRLSAAEGKRRLAGSARAALMEIIKPGDTVYCMLRHVSASGMYRRISLFVMEKSEPRNIDGYCISLGIGDRPRNRQEGIGTGGCGMDMGFHLVYTLSRVLFPDGFGVRSEGGIRPRSKEHAAQLVKEKKTSFCGRNGDTSGWDNDGGYALRHRWL